MRGLTVTPRALAFLLMASLSGCAMVSSPMPLIDVTDPVPRLGDGRYQIFVLTQTAEAKAFSRHQRATCIQADFLVPRDDAGAAPGSTALYCPFQDGKAVPIATVKRRGVYLEVSGAPGSAFVRLRELNDELLLLQFGDDAKRQPSDYIYGVVRMRDPNLELYWLECDTVPAIRVVDKDGQISCTAPSIEAMSADLARFATRIDEKRETPLALARKLPD